jgi:hypothetical protein
MIDELIAGNLIRQGYLIVLQHIHTVIFTVHQHNSKTRIPL